MAVIAAIALPTSLSAASKSYDVVPYSNCVAQTTIAGTDVIQYYRNTLDSLVTVSVWIGDTFVSQPYNVVIVDSAMPAHQIAHGPSGGQHAPKCWAWLDFPLTEVAQPVRGRTYKVIVSRSVGAISFAYDPRNPYTYGRAVANSTPPMTADDDIALRVVGLHDVVDSTYFGAVEVPWELFCYSGGYPGPLCFNEDTFRTRIDSSKVRSVLFALSWDLVQRAGPDSWNWDLVDRTLRGIRADAGCRPLALVGGPPVGGSGQDSWASTRYDSMDEYGGRWNDTLPVRWSTHCAPRGLDYPVTSESNLLARFIDSAVHHYDNDSMPIHEWQVGNENNDTTSLPGYPTSSSHYSGWWRRPNRYYDIGDGLRPLCSLYMRMAQVVDLVVKSHDGHESDKVAIGSMASVFRIDTAGVVAGKDWLDNCYAAASENGWGVFWDAVSVHDYQRGDTLAPESLRVHAETLRTVMRERGDVGGELWNTEFGWNSVDTADPEHYSKEQDARNLCEAFVSHKASEANPGGGYDRLYWWYLHRPGVWGAWGLVNDYLNRQSPFYAMKQVAGSLTGKRLNGRVLTGDSATDAQVRMYEFENPATSKKTWVCWRSDGGVQDVAVELPARTDSASLEALDYGEQAPPTMRQANSYGWLGIGASDRPQFVAEPASESVSRPELAVDSFKALPLPLRVGEPSSFSVFAKNNGDERTPGQVQVNIYWNDSLLTTVACDTIPAHEGRWAIVIGGYIPAWVHGTGLLRAEANPGQEYVEETGIDDNCGYIRTSSSRRPVGDIGVVCGSHSNEPPALLRIESHSLEADTTGATPCDSARLVQWWYGLRDTVVHGGDTTAWFSASVATVLDTSWLYLSGQGMYKLFLQLKDSWSMSDLIPDTTHPYVVFDTTGPTGSVVINDGARFATGSTCALRLAAYDSASGVGWMRFMNRPQVDLAENGGFSASLGSWSFTNGAYDTSLAMARLSLRLRLGRSLPQ
jgi:hypothetical protein